MFESSLIALDQKKPRGKAWLALPLAVVLHPAVLVSLGFAQYWHAAEGLEPRIIEVYPQPVPPPLPVDSGETKAQSHRESGSPVRHASAEAQSKPLPETPLRPTVPEIRPTSPSDSRSTRESGNESHRDSAEEGGCMANGGRSRTDVREDEDEVRPPVDDAPILVGGAVTRPVLLAGVEPKYTELARRVHLEGTVVLQAVIDEQGRVVDAKV